MSTQLSERIKDLALVSVLALVGIGGFLFINLNETEAYPGAGGLTWRSMPFIYSGILLILVALFAASTLLDIWLIRSGRTARSLLGEVRPSSADGLTNFRRAAAFVAILVYAWALSEFGFALVTPVLLFSMLFVLGRRDLKENAVVALVGTLAMWILFVGILKLPMTGETWDPLTPILNGAWRGIGFR